MDRYIRFRNVNIVDSFFLDETGELRKENFNFIRVFNHIKSGDRLVFDNLKATFKLIKNLFFAHGLKGVDNNIKINLMPINSFIEIATENKVYGFSTKIKINGETKINVFCDYENLLPNIDWGKIGGFSEKTLLETLKKEKEEGLNGFTIAGAIWKNWQRLNKSRFSKSRLSYRNNYFQIEDEIIKDSESLCMCGLNFVNPKFEKRLINNVNLYDVNSLYPYIALNYPLPNGNPIKEDLFENNQRYEIKLYKINVIKAKIKKGFVPFIHSEKSNNFNWLLPFSFSDKVLWLWDVEYNEFLKKYENVSIVLKVYSFQAKLGLLDDYLRPLQKEKEEDTVKKDYLSRFFHKKKLNLFLGKFASRREVWNRVEVERGKFENFHFLDNAKYVWLFAYITAFARIYLAKKINNFIGLENLVMCDTDSIYSLDCLGNDFLNLDNVKFGHFKKEDRALQFCIKGKKQYVYLNENGEIITTIAGVQSELGRVYTPLEFSQQKCEYYREEWDLKAEIPTKKLAKVLI